MILTATQQAIQDTVRSYAQAELRPKATSYETAGRYPSAVFSALANIGLFGMTTPEVWGGAGADYVSYALALTELAAGDGAISTIVSVHNSLVIDSLLTHGSEHQKETFLPGLISGVTIGSFALTEPGAGSDASKICTRAERVRGGYLLKGTKQFITSGHICGLAITFALTDPSAGKHGITAFLVPTDRTGYIVDKVEHKLGQHASDTCSIRFADLFVEDDLVLGEVGAGYRIALSNLELGRIGIAAQSVGMADNALSIAIKYAKERTSFGKTIIEHQAVGFRLADACARLEAARQMVLHAAALKDAGQQSLIQASMAKLVASETAECVVSSALQTLGGYGYLEEFGLAKIYRDVRVCQIYEGTSDIQRLVIARHL